MQGDVIRSCFGATMLDSGTRLYHMGTTTTEDFVVFRILHKCSSAWLCVRNCCMVGASKDRRHCIFSRTFRYQPSILFNHGMTIGLAISVDFIHQRRAKGYIFSPLMCICRCNSKANLATTGKSVQLQLDRGFSQSTPRRTNATA